MSQMDRYRSIPRRPILAPDPPRAPAPVSWPPTSATGGLDVLAARVLGDGPTVAGASGATPPPQTLAQGRRFLPPASGLPSADSHVVGPGERLDLLAAKLLGDPLLYWQIADANDAVDIFDLCRPGRVLRLPSATGSVAGAIAGALMFTSSDSGRVEDPS